jgi:hypothetical protein
MSDVLSQAGWFAKLSLFMGLVPLVMGIVYAASPSEQRLALMRPLSLAAIFAAVSGTGVGLLHVFRGMGMMDTPALSRAAATGIAESLVLIFFNFGCLTVAWLCVSLGLWRRP